MRHFNLVKSLTRVINNTSSPSWGKSVRGFILILSLAVFGVNEAWAAWNGSGNAVSGSGTTWYVYDYSAEQSKTAGGLFKVTFDEFSLSGPGQKIEFQAKKATTGSGDLKLQKYSGSWADIWNNGLTTSYISYDATIDVNTTKLQFYMPSGSLKKYVKNIKVTMAQYIEDPSVSSLDCGSGIVGSSSTSHTVTVAWCNVPGMTYQISGTNANLFSVSLDINAEYGKYNTSTFTVTYEHSTVGEHSATLTISDSYNGYSKTVTLSGVTTRKTAEITWGQGTNLMNVDEYLENPASSTNGTLDVKYASSDPSVIEVLEGSVLHALKYSATPVTITAYQEESGDWARVEKQQTITVTNKQKQSIDWTEKLSFEYSGSQYTYQLSASASSSITYSIATDGGSIASVSGNILTIKGIGKTTITATAAETDDYVGVSVTRRLTVRNPNATCDDPFYEEPNEHSFTAADGKSWETPTFTYEPHTVSFQAYKTMATAVGSLYVYEYVNNSWKEIKEIGVGSLDKNSYKDFGPYELSRGATKVKIGTKAGSYIRYIRNIEVTLSKYLESATTELNFTAEAGAKAPQQTFYINYSNIQGPISISCTDTKGIFSFPDEIDAECGDVAKNVPVTVDMLAQSSGSVSETLTLTDKKGQTISVTLKATVSKLKQSIEWDDETNYKTTDSPVLTAKSSTLRDDMPVTYHSGDETIAQVNGSKVTFLKAGDVTIYANQAGNTYYDAAPEVSKVFHVSKVTPTITPPTASTITYGAKLKTSTFSNGKAKVNLRGTETEITGIWSWDEGEDVKTANNGTALSYPVTFTPEDGGMYNAAKCSVQVQINRANQTITWNVETNISQNTPSSDVLNATTTGDGSIVYTIDNSSDVGVGTITNNVLTIHKSGKLVINANVAATANYNAATQVQKTFEVGKRGVTITWEDKDESGNVIITYAAGSGDIGNHFVAHDAQTNEVIDIPVTITQSSHTDVVSIQMYVNCAGTATITATTEATDQYGAGLGTVTLTSLINTPDFEWQIPQPAPNTAYGNFFTSTNKDSDCNLTFTSNNPTLAKVDGGKLIVGGNDQTEAEVTFTVTQSGNCRWNEHTETFTIHIKKPANHVPFTITKDNYNEFKAGGSGAFSWDNGMKVGKGGILDGGMNWDDKTFILHFSGIPDKLSFSYNCANVFGVATQPGWWVKESEDGINWPEEKLWNETSDSESETQAPTQQLKPKTRYLMFCYSGNFAGVFKNINVTELKYFYAAPNKTATEHVESINMGTYDGVGDFPVERIYLRHANAGSDLQITIEDTKNFRLEHNISTGTDQMGDDPITIIYEPDDFGTHHTTLTIHDGQNPDIEIPISAAAQPGATYTFNGTDGVAEKLENWLMGGITPTSLPNAYHTVYVQQPMVISSEMAFYALDIKSDQYPNAKVTIAPTGGLTVGQMGISGASVDNLIIQSSIEPGKEGQGYLRISPKYTGIMPNATVQFATRSTLNTGANKDATWQYFGIPVASLPFRADYITWLYEWNEPSGWLFIGNNMQSDATLTAWTGYAITQYGQPTYEFTGKLLNNDPTITLTKTEDGMNGDNLFANSYSAPIDVKRFTEDDFVGNVTRTFYIFNSGSWNQWDDHKEGIVIDGSLNSTTPGQYIGIPVMSAAQLPEATYLTMIAPMQGVYVVAEEGTDTEHPAQIKLNYTKHVWNGYSKTNQMVLPQRAPQRTISSEIDPVYARELAIRDSIRQVDEAKVRALTHRFNITAYSSNSGADNVCAIECPTYAHTYENGYDAPKIMADNEGVLNIYTNEADCGLMAVSATNSVDSMYIGFQAGDDSEYSLYITSVIGDSLLLLDTETDEVFALVDSAVYNFHATPNQANDFRFRIIDYGKRMREQGHYTPTSWQDVNRTNVRIWYAKHKLYITDAKKNSFAQIYTADGALVSTTPFHYTTSLNVDNLAAGVYFVHVDNAVYKFVTL